MDSLLLVIVAWWISTRRRVLGHDTIYNTGWFEQEFTDYQFFKCYRISKDAFAFLQQRLSQHYQDSIPIKQGLLITLWILGNDISYRCAEETIGLCYSAVCRVFRHVVKLIVVHLGDQITYDKPAQFYEEQAVRFTSRFGVLNACCVMDGTLIKTRKPKVNGECYYSGYKKAYGISMLVVSTIDREVIYVSAGYPGSVHDVAVLKASALWDDAENNRIPINANYTILGDSAFPDVPWITISAGNIGFASPRTISEHTFARLKSKFRILDGTVRQDIALVPAIVISSCVLSNLDLKSPSNH